MPGRLNRKEPPVTVNDYVASLIRTAVPAAIGLFLGVPVVTAILDGISKLGVTIDPDKLGAFLEAIAITGWYAVARWLEKFPVFKWVNGLAKTPTY